ncbi:hypothetical protein OKW43_001010 [Paraburkholderia sp. WC7.3g]|nr:hypothetical protein [Paraburkholderia podalyriae]
MPSSLKMRAAPPACIAMPYALHSRDEKWRYSVCNEEPGLPVVEAFE